MSDDGPEWFKYVVEFIWKQSLSGDSTNNKWSCLEDCTVYIYVYIVYILYGMEEAYGGLVLAVFNHQVLMLLNYLDS
jgi:hypothetical protein